MHFLYRRRELASRCDGAEQRASCASSSSCTDDCVPPDDVERLTEQEAYECKTEYDVVHDAARARPRGAARSASATSSRRSAARSRSASRTSSSTCSRSSTASRATTSTSSATSSCCSVPYTGCNPRGLMLARDKALSKKLLAYHRIPSPRFAVFPRGRRVRTARRGSSFPLIVKSLTEEASLGISQASVVESDEKLASACGSSTSSIGSRRDRRGVHRGPRALRRRHRQPAPRTCCRCGSCSSRTCPRGALAIATAQREVRPRVPGEARHRRRSEAKDLPPRPRARIQRTSQAHLPHPRPRRLRAHRLPPRRGRQALLPRGEPEPRHRARARTSPPRPAPPGSRTRSSSSAYSTSGSGAQGRTKEEP